MMLHSDFPGFDISTYCSVDNLATIRTYIRSRLNMFSIKNSDVEMIVLAVDEICTNSIIHASQNNPSKYIGIKCERKANSVVIEIADKGTSYDVSAYEEPTLEQLISQKSRGNMGLMIVKKIMDHIDYIHTEGLNICRLQKAVA